MTRRPVPFEIGPVHFIGIGGIGMSGLAEILRTMDFDVSGSDMKASDVTRRLETLGVKVHVGHKAENVHGADVVVHSSAIQHNNPELARARVAVRGLDVLGVEIDPHEARARIRRRERERRVAEAAPDLAIVERVQRGRREPVDRGAHPETRRAQVAPKPSDVGDACDVAVAHAIEPYIIAHLVHTPRGLQIAIWPARSWPRCEASSCRATAPCRSRSSRYPSPGTGRSC